MNTIQNQHFIKQSPLMKSILILLFAVFCAGHFVYGQGSIGIGTITPDASAVLDLTSADRGVLVPRMSASARQAIASPAIGLMVFDSTAGAFYYFTGNGWLELLAGKVDQIADADNDTKIQMEETADEDIIRFDIAGTEYFTMNDGRLNVLNTGNSVFLGNMAGEDDDLSTNQNVFVGHKAGQKCTSCANNVSLGYQAFSQNPNNMFTGTQNTAIGSFSLLKGLGQSNNTAIGYNALGSMAGGTANVAVGSLAWLGNLQGNYGVVIGASAGQSVQNGDGNVLLGYAAGSGSGSHTKARNVMIGYQSGQLNHKNDNVFIGYQSGQNELNGNRLYIENTNADSANALIYGEFDNDWVRINGRLSPMEGMTDADGDTRIQVDENADEDFIRFDVAGNEKMVLDASGELVVGGMRLKQIGSSSKLHSNTYPDNYLEFLSNNASLLNANDFLHLQADEQTRIMISRYDSISMYDKTKFHDEVQLYSLSTDAAAQKVLLADPAGNIRYTDLELLKNGLSDADNDTRIQVEESADEDKIRFDIGGIEYFVMDSGRIDVLNTGNSVFLGFESGLSDDFSDNRNAGVGHQALKDNTTGRWNSALGYAALRGNTTGENNVAIGFAAQSPVNATGSDNVAIGKYALSFNNSGNRNVAIGANAGFNLSSGSGNVFIGYDAGKGQNFSNRLMIDNSDTTDALVYGEFDNHLVRINGDLDVTGDFPGRDIITDSDDDTKIQVEENADEDAIRFDLAGEQHLVLRSNGNGQTMLEITGDITSGNTFLGSNAGLTSAGTFNVLIGQGTGRDLTSGDANTFVGRNAGTLTTTGGSNVFLGYHCGRSNNGNDNVYLGRAAGELSTGSSNVFIGLHAGYNETGSNKLFIENSDAATPLIWGDFATNRLGVNRVASTNTLEVGGNASKNSAGDWLANSDVRLKSHITALSGEEILNKMLRLQGISYEWHDDKTGTERPEGIQYGFTAQNIREVFPELVMEDNMGYLQTAYGTYDAMYVECIRVLTQQIELLHQENIEIKKEMARIDRLEAKIAE
jgi:hypothetical protein